MQDRLPGQARKNRNSHQDRSPAIHIVGRTVGGKGIPCDAEHDLYIRKGAPYAYQIEQHPACDHYQEGICMGKDVSHIINCVLSSVPSIFMKVSRHSFQNTEHPVP